VYPLIRVRLCLIILFLYISLESYNEKQFYVEIYVLAVFKMTIYIGNITDHDDYYTSDYTGTEQTVLATILMFIIIFSLYGNGGMIIVLYKNDRMWNSTNILIGNLAVVAALTTLLIMPFSLTSMILQRWPFADGPICKFNAFLASQLLLYTIFIHTMISIDKYFAVVKPFSRAMTVRRTWLTSFVLWTIASFMSLGPLIHIGEYQYNKTALVCGVGFPKNKIDSIYMLLLFALGFIIPNVVNAHVYFKVFRAVRQHSKRLHKTSISSSFDVLKLQKRLVLTAFFSLLCFLLCWTPFAVYVTMAIVSESIDRIPHGLGVSAYWSGYMYNAINPLIICTMSTRFGDGLYELTMSLVQVPSKIFDYCFRSSYEKGTDHSSAASTPSPPSAMNSNNSNNKIQATSGILYSSSSSASDFSASNDRLTTESHFIVNSKLAAAVDNGVNSNSRHKVVSSSEIILAVKQS